MITTRLKIKELIGNGSIVEVQDGNHGEKHPTASDYVDDGIPFLMARDFHDGQVDLVGACKIPKRLGDALRIGFAKTGDVLLTHKGSIGLVAIVPAVSDYVMLTPQVTYYRTNPTKLLNKYLKYAFQSPFFRHQLASFSAQSTRPYIGITAQKELELEVPPLVIQRRIASILSAYDDLIENSQYRIRILEDMARVIYREWFVHFRFPGCADHPRVASPLGDIPQGWEVTKLGELTACLSRGIAPAYDENGDSIVLNQKCIRDQRVSLEPARRQKKSIPSDKRIRFGDVLINSTGVGTLGRVAQVYEELVDCTVDTHVTIARPSDDIDPDYFGCMLHSHQQSFERLGIGATGQTELSRTAIADLVFVL
jgi:type I restriction enzyme S subunit